MPKALSALDLHEVQPKELDGLFRSNVGEPSDFQATTHHYPGIGGIKNTINHPNLRSIPLLANGKPVAE